MFSDLTPGQIIIIIGVAIFLFKGVFDKGGKGGRGGSSGSSNSGGAA